MDGASGWATGRDEGAAIMDAANCAEIYGRPHPLPRYRSFELARSNRTWLPLLRHSKGRAISKPGVRWRPPPSGLTTTPSCASESSPRCAHRIGTCRARPSDCHQPYRWVYRRHASHPRPSAVLYGCDCRGRTFHPAGSSRSGEWHARAFSRNHRLTGTNRYPRRSKTTRATFRRSRHPAPHGPMEVRRGDVVTDRTTIPGVREEAGQRMRDPEVTVTATRQTGSVHPREWASLVLP